VTALLKRGKDAETLNVAGQVEASDNATLRSQVSGTVTVLRVKEGDRVNSGEVVAQLDKTDQQLVLAQARARLAEAQSQLAELKRGSRSEVIAQRRAAVQSALAREAAAKDNLLRIKRLVQQGALADRALIEARTAIDTAVSDRFAAKANLAEAKAGPRRDEIAAEAANVAAEQAAVNQAALGVERTQIVATSAGIVNQRLVSVGDYVRSADPILELVDNSSVDILLQVPEKLAGDVQPGLSVKLTSRALPGWSRTATIDALLPTASDSSRRRPARIRLSNPPAGLLPGTAVNGSFTISSERGGYRISRDALTRRGNQWLVFGIEKGPKGMSARQIPVDLISDEGETVVINSPALSDDLEIVLKGGDALADKAAIMVVQGPSAGPPPGRAAGQGE
jgi:multidrug resistance efflux pump